MSGLDVSADYNFEAALVTGGAGFLGAHLVRELDEFIDGAGTVVALDDLSGGYEDNVPEQIELVEGSINDTDLVRRLFDEYNFDVVYHLAAYAAEGLSHFIRRFNYRNNLLGSVNLINESVRHSVDCFVFTSSIAVYGDVPVPMKETINPEPKDPYGVAKYAVELDLAAAQQMFGLDYVIFRPHNVYGELQNIGDQYRNVVGIFMNQIMQDEPLTIFGDGEQVRAFSYVEDIIDTVALAPGVPDARGRVFNIGSDRPVTVNELAETVIEVMADGEHAIEYLEPRNEVKVAYCDHSAAKSVFGEEEETELRMGIEKMAKWAKEVGARRTPQFGKIEIEEGLPEVWRQ